MTEVLQDHAAEFRAYTEILAPLNEQSPQRQGMEEVYYQKALDNPSVRSTDVTLETGETIRVPQLAPVDQYPWLNAEFYEKTFPEEYGAGKVRHYLDIPGIEPSEAVKDELQKLAAEGGVLVFDYPAIDPDAPDRVAALLQSLDITKSEDVELGKQTYYAGKCRLKRRELEEAPENMRTTFHRMIEDGELEENPVNGAAYRELVDEQQAPRLYDVYEKAFQKLNDDPCKQGIDADKFMEIITSKPEMFKLVNNKDGEITTLCVFGTDVTEYDWLNSEVFAAQFPEETARDEMVYFPAIATDPDMAGEFYTEPIVQLLSQMSEAGGHEVIVAFDCCSKNKLLARYIQGLINKTPELSIKFEKIGTQTYAATKLAA